MVFSNMNNSLSSVFLCGHIGHAKRDCAHPKMLDANIGIIDYGSRNEGGGLQYTSVLWSMRSQELKDSIEEKHMINMLIDPFHNFSSPMMSQLKIKVCIKGFPSVKAADQVWGILWVVQNLLSKWMKAIMIKWFQNVPNMLLLSYIICIRFQR